jgi:hypothetical protein
MNELTKCMKSNCPASPSAYLWARCEGWVKLGVHHAVIVDPEGGKVLDEQGHILLRRDADGLWIESDKAQGGMRYDQVAVTHLPIDPWRMSKSDWQEKLAEREAKLSQGMENRRAKTTASPDLFPEAPQKPYP